MRHIEIVMTVIRQADKYYLQLRNGAAQNGGLGLIGFFGGMLESSETPAQAAARELSEETNLSPQPIDLEYIGEVRVTSDRDNEQTAVHAQIFQVEVAADQQIKAREGELVSLTKEEALADLSKFTTGTRACFEELLAKEQ